MESLVEWIQRQFASIVTEPFCDLQPDEVHDFHGISGWTSAVKVPACCAKTPALRESAARARDWYILMFAGVLKRVTENGMVKTVFGSTE